MSRFIAAYQAFVSQATDAPPEFGHTAALACLSTIALGRRWIDRGQTGIKPNLFFLLVAGSSRDRKSTTVDMAMSILKDVEPDRVGPKDFTAEGLVAFMGRKGSDDKQRSKLIVPMSEFGQYLSSAQSYGATTATTLCTLYDGEDYDRARAMGGGVPLSIIRPRVSILGAVAYGMLEKYADSKDWTTGFFNRFLFVIPQGNRPRLDQQPQFPHKEADHARAYLGDLAKFLEANKCPMFIDPASNPVFMRLAQEIPADLPDPVESAQRERLLNATWKLAMLYQIDIDPSAPIGPEATNYACCFALHSWNAFREVYSRTSTDDFGRLLRRVTEYVARFGTTGVSKSQLLKNFSIAASKLQPVLDVLLRFQTIEQHEVPSPESTIKGRTKSMLVARKSLSEGEIRVPKG